jgi:hypothetical protein
VAAVIVVIMDMLGMMGMVVVYVETPPERKHDELRFCLEPEGRVDDELPNIVKTSVHRQYATRVWVLWDRSGKDVGSKFGREVREGRHGEFRGSPP